MSEIQYNSYIRYNCSKGVSTLSKSNLLAESKLIILYLLYQMDMPISTSQIVEFAVDGEYMDFFSFQQYIHELTDTKLLESFVENNNTFYTLTDEGEQTLLYFTKQIPESKRNTILSYVRKNKKRIKREYEVVANYFYNGENDYVVKCGVYEDDMTLMEISVSVVSKEQAKLVRKNWRANVTKLYGSILSELMNPDGTDNNKIKVDSLIYKTSENKETSNKDNNPIDLNSAIE